MENNVIIAYMNNIFIYTETISKNIKKSRSKSTENTLKRHP